MANNNSITVSFSDEITECKGVLFEIASEEIKAGDTVELMLWGGSTALLSEYTLYKGTQTMGAGISAIDSSTDSFEPIIDFAETYKSQLDYPIERINKIIAVTEIFTIDDNNNVVTWASRGSTVTNLFARHGYSCLITLDRKLLYGSVKAYCTRSPYKKSWFWTIPDGEEGLHWFFIYKANMVLDHKFSIELPDLASSVLAYRNITIKVVDKDSDAGISGAIVAMDGVVVGTANSAGMVYVSGVRTGSHTIHITAESYLDSDQDDLNNETIEIY